MTRLFYWMLCLTLLLGCSKDHDDDNKIKIGEDFTETVSGIELEMVYVKGGTFRMGATEEQGDDAYDDEYPVHSVTLSDYYIGKFEVT